MDETSRKVTSYVRRFLPAPLQLEISRVHHGVIEPLTYPAKSTYTVSSARTIAQTNALRAEILSPIRRGASIAWHIMNWTNPALTIMYMSLYFASVITGTLLRTVLVLMAIEWVREWARRNPDVVRTNIPTTAQDVASVVAQPLVSTVKLDTQGNLKTEQSWSDYFSSAWSSVADGDFAFDFVVEVLRGLRRKWSSPWTLAVLGAVFATSWIPVGFGVRLGVGLFAFVGVPILTRAPRLREEIMKRGLKYVGRPIARICSSCSVAA